MQDIPKLYLEAHIIAKNAVQKNGKLVRINISEKNNHAIVSGRNTPTAAGNAIIFTEGSDELVINEPRAGSPNTFIIYGQGVGAQ